MNRIKYALVICFVALGMSACEDVIVKDISDKTIELLGPHDATEVGSQKLTFWWEEMDGASSYELLIVSPDRQATLIVALDTVITKSKFDFELSQGSYEWCVRGINNGYKTEYVCRRVKILTGN